jgi:hypothetical protein
MWFMTAAAPRRTSLKKADSKEHPITFTNKEKMYAYTKRKLSENNET